MSLLALVLVTLASVCMVVRCSRSHHPPTAYEVPRLYYAPDYVDHTPAYTFAVVNTPYHFFSVYQTPAVAPPTILAGPGLFAPAEGHVAYAPSYRTSLVPQNAVYVPERSFVTPEAVFESDSAQVSISETVPETFPTHQLTSDPTFETPDASFEGHTVPFYGDDSDSPTSGTLRPTFIPASFAPPSPNIVRGEGGMNAPIFNPHNPSTPPYSDPSSEETYRTPSYNPIRTAFYPSSSNIIRGEEVHDSFSRTALHALPSPGLPPTPTARTYDPAGAFPNPSSPTPTDFTKPLFRPTATTHDGRAPPVIHPYDTSSHDHHSDTSPEHVPTPPRVLYEAPGHSHPQRR